MFPWTECTRADDGVWTPARHDDVRNFGNDMSLPERWHAVPQGHGGGSSFICISLIVLKVLLLRFHKHPGPIHQACFESGSIDNENSLLIKLHY